MPVVTPERTKPAPVAPPKPAPVVPPQPAPVREPKTSPSPFAPPPWVKPGQEPAPKA